MEYKKFSFHTQPETAEILLAYLEDLPFEMFEDHATGMDAYIPDLNYSDEVLKEVQDLQQQFDFQFEVEHVPDQNWNIKWESNFEPVIVNDFCAIRATFHAPITTTSYELIIDPKMSFGTGHHATTYMMIDAMKSIDFKDKNVLDFGSGTGILAFLAKRLGSGATLAIDNDEWCYNNALENAELNALTGQVQLQIGSLEDVKKEAYDVILANINKHILLRYVTDFKTYAHENTQLLLSGILEQDLEDIQEAFEAHGFKFVNHSSREGWICCKFIGV